MAARHAIKILKPRPMYHFVKVQYSYVLFHQGPKWLGTTPLGPNAAKCYSIKVQSPKRLRPNHSTSI